MRDKLVNALVFVLAVMVWAALRAIQCGFWVCGDKEAFKGPKYE